MPAPTASKFTRDTQRAAVNNAVAKQQASAEKQIGRMRTIAGQALERINTAGSSTEKRLQIATAALTKLGAAPAKRSAKS